MHRGHNWGYEGERERGCEYTGETTGVIIKERVCECTGETTEVIVKERDGVNAQGKQLGLL